MEIEKFFKELSILELQKQKVIDDTDFGIQAIGMGHNILLSAGKLNPTNLPIGLGPFEQKDIKQDLGAKFLKPHAFTGDMLRRSQRYMERETDLQSLIRFPDPSRPNTQIQIKRDLITGILDINDFVEIFVDEAVENAKNSTSLQRDPSHAVDFIRGNSNNKPFIPGGMKCENGKDKDFSNIAQKQSDTTILPTDPG